MLIVSHPTVLITGSTNGIGRATALALAARGARVIIHGRSRWKVWHAVRAIRRATGRHDVDGTVADLGDPHAVEALAVRVAARTERLDVLIHNAAIVPLERTTTRDGLEMQFAVNHLAVVLLTYRLVGLLRRSAPARIVVVASQLERNGRLDFEDLQSARSYDANRVYATTKLQNVLFTAELARRLAGSGVTANCVHPGIAGTGVLNSLHGRPRWHAPWTRYAHPAPSGATAPVSRVATDPELEQVNGAYFQGLVRADPSPQARDADAARRLWETSASLLGISPELPRE